MSSTLDIVYDFRINIFTDNNRDAKESVYKSEKKFTVKFHLIYYIGTHSTFTICW